MVVSEVQIAFHSRLAHILGTLGERGFWTTLAAFLRDEVHFDSWVAMIFHPEKSPTVLYEGDSDLEEDLLFDEYIRVFYALDPFYVFSMRGIMPGLYRLDEVAPEYFRQTEYFRSYFARNVVSDELQFLYPLSHGDVVSLSLGTERRFNEDEVGKLCIYSPWILVMLERAVILCQPPASSEKTPEKDNAPGEQAKKIANGIGELESRLRSNGVWHLTEREIRTALLILSGYSTKNIARLMGISPDTVKVHRRNLYRKLGVSTQAGVFALCLKNKPAEA